MAIYEEFFNIRFSDIGMFGKLSNKAFLSIMEDIGGFHSNLAGYGVNNIPETHLSWVLLRLEIKNIQKT